jgi:RimJ/RimL family protein N-acetyltransferase
MILSKEKYDILLEKVNKNPIENVRFIYYIKFSPEKIINIYCDDVDDPKACAMIIQTPDYTNSNNGSLWAESEEGYPWIVDWFAQSERIMFISIPENIYDVLAQELGIEGDPAELWYLPEDVEIGEPKYTPESLRNREADIEEVNQNWTYSTGKIQNYVREKIKNNESIAIYFDDELASYAFYKESGAMGMLRTLPKFRGKGLAKSITYSMAKRIREEGRLPYCFIIPENSASQKVVSDCGFVKDGRFFWYWKEK